MRNDKFWDHCNNNSIRKKVSEFIEKTPALSKLKNKAYYDLEDAMVDFIYENRDMISKEVDLEYQRDDFLTRAKDEFGENAEEVAKFLPIDIIDIMVEIWQRALLETDEYWEIIWDTLSDLLTDGGISPFVGIDGYDLEDVLIYCVYLKEWFNDVPPEMQGEMLPSIDEFFLNEMEDKKLSNYYTKIAKKLFGNKIKK